VEHNISELKILMDSGVKVKKPFLVDNFLSEEDFLELKNFLQSYDYKSLDFSDIMNKYEQTVDVSSSLVKKVDERARELFGSATMIPAYHMFAHHQITEDGDVPLLSLHLDESPGTYVVDLIIDYSVEWPIVIDKQIFYPKPNQAVLFYAEDQMHYRPKWPSDSREDFYQAIFFHYTEPDHWSKRLGISHRESQEAQLYFKNKRNEAYRHYFMNKSSTYSLPEIPEPKSYTD
jgi:hypothetical protein